MARHLHHPDFSPIGFTALLAGVVLLSSGLVLLALEDWRLVVPILLLGILSLPVITRPLGTRPRLLWTGAAAGAFLAGGTAFLLPHL